MEEMHFSAPFFSRGGSRSTPATSPVPRPHHRHSKRRLPFQSPRAIGLIHGASTQPHGTLTSRNDAASVVSGRTRGHTLRSERLSNATERILKDHPARLKGRCHPALTGPYRGVSTTSPKLR
jgi:hypothetical protein